MFSFTWTPGYQLAPGELITNDIFNLGMQGTGAISGVLADLTNVSTTAPVATGQALVWNVGTGKWEPGVVAAAYLTEMVGCTSIAAGVKGVCKAPVAGDQEKYWAGSAEWKTLPTASAKDGADLFLATRYR
jgi:hypothetical protein